MIDLTRQPSNDAERQRVRMGMAVASAALLVTLAGVCGVTPGTVFQRGGCPDSSPRPVAASVEPVLASIDGSALVAGGPRDVDALFDDRARGDALLQQADAHGVQSGWTEEWAFPDGDALHADVTEFPTSAEASAFGIYEAEQGCPKTIALHDLGSTGVTATQTERPGPGDGWEAVVVRDNQVVRLFVASDDATLTLDRLESAVRLIHAG